MTLVPSEMVPISEGTSVIVRSRVNEDQIYKGAVTKVETDTSIEFEQ